MNKVIIFLCLIVVLIAQINYTAYAQTAYPTGYPSDPAPTNPDPDPNPTSDPGGTGPIEAGGKCKNDEDLCRDQSCCPKGKCKISPGCKK